MKQYVVDELRPADYEKLKSCLDGRYGASGVEGIYWVPLDPQILRSVQIQHEDCQPFYVAIELEPNQMACELLVRTRSRMRCECMQYASAIQLKWIIQLVDDLFEELQIKT